MNLDELLVEKQERDEFRRCAPDWDTSTPEELLEAFEYFCATYIYIRFPGKGKILFELRDAQRETVSLWLNERFTLALKARQIGFSTLVSVFCFWLAFFYTDRQIIMLSKGERESIKLLAKAKYAYRFMPDWMKMRGPVVAINQTKMEMTNESIIESLPSASDPARGETAFLIVVDELGQLPNSEDAWASIEPTTDVGGWAIMLGTANGEGNLFHDLWQGADGTWIDRDGTVRYEGLGSNRFKSIFHGWWTGGRDDAWYESKKRDMPEWQLAQEYPSNPDEAFLRSGRPIFNVDKLRELEVRDPKRGYVAMDAKGTPFFREDGGNLKVWVEPSEKGVYSIGVDVAEGLEHGDFSSAHVINVKTMEVVAHWHGHVDPDQLATEVLVPLGRWYNRALLIVESNNHGLTTLTALKREKYHPMYRTRRLGSATTPVTEQLGWRTTQPSKRLAIDELNEVLRDLELFLWDKETVAELRTFVREGNGKMHGSPHDDRVMSLAIANQGLKYVYWSEYRASPKPGPGTIGFTIDQAFKLADKASQPSKLGGLGVRAA